MFEDMYYLRGKKEAKKSALSAHESSAAYTHTHTHTHTHIYIYIYILDGAFSILQDGLTLPRLFLCLFFMSVHGIDRIDQLL